MDRSTEGSGLCAHLSHLSRGGQLKGTKEQERCLLLGPPYRQNNEAELYAMTSSATNHHRRGGAGLVCTALGGCQMAKGKCRCKAGVFYPLSLCETVEESREAAGKSSLRKEKIRNLKCPGCVSQTTWECTWSPCPTPDSESLCLRRQSVTSFPVLLARQRASISGKLLTVAGAGVCRCVFNWGSKHQRKRGGQGRECGRSTDSVSTGVSQPEILGTWRLICSLLSSRKHWQSYE